MIEEDISSLPLVHLILFSSLNTPLKYLLIDKSGLNLRNKVAHSLMKKRDYYWGNANLLILALLKICAFKLNLKRND